jgi:hypothetical protein
VGLNDRNITGKLWGWFSQCNKELTSIYTRETVRLIFLKVTGKLWGWFQPEIRTWRISVLKCCRKAFFRTFTKDIFGKETNTLIIHLIPLIHIFFWNEYFQTWQTSVCDYFELYESKGTSISVAMDRSWPQALEWLNVIYLNRTDAML